MLKVNNKNTRTTSLTMMTSDEIKCTDFSWNLVKKVT